MGDYHINDGYVDIALVFAPHLTISCKAFKKKKTKSGYGYSD